MGDLWGEGGGLSVVRLLSINNLFMSLKTEVVWFLFLSRKMRELKKKAFMEFCLSDLGPARLWFKMSRKCSRSGLFGSDLES